jgi:hypothetical protein
MKSRFFDIKKMLTRDEMRQIKGASGGGGGGGGITSSCPGGSPIYTCSYEGDIWTTSCCHGRTPNYITGTTCYVSGTVPAGGQYSDGSAC